MARFSSVAVLSVLQLVLAACSHRTQAPSGAIAPTAPPAPREQLQHVMDRYWEALVAARPLLATQSGDHRYDDRLGQSLSPRGLADGLALERRALAELLGVAPPPEGSDARLDYDLFKRERELAIDGYVYPEELFPVNPFEGMLQDFALMGALDGPQPFATQKDYENWLARADAYVEWTDQAIENMRDGLRRGYVLPREVVLGLLPELEMLGTDGPDNPFYRPLDRMPANIGGDARRALSRALRIAIADKILASERKLHDFLKNEYLPRTASGGGLARLPLGEAWYAHEVSIQTGTTMTAHEIHELGLAEVERARARLQSALLAAGVSADAKGYFDGLRADAPLLEVYGNLEAEAVAAAPAVLSDPPATPVVLLGAERFQDLGGEPIRYRGATPDGAFPAVLYVDLRSERAGAAPLPVLLAAYLPGRHAQYEAQQRTPGLADFRKFGREPAYSEGWSLYAEGLGEEMGLYRDAATRCTALRDELLASIMIVVDTGLHANSWSRRRAIDYFVTEAPISERTAAALVDRTLALPGHGLAAGMGAMRLRALRARAQEKLGARFDLRAFHAYILAQGPLPLDFLEARTLQWIEGETANR
jgi:uncharacterized protein (DUF885 family)